MYYTSFSSESTNHGIVNERHVQNKYVEHLKFNSINVYVKQLGLLLSKSHPYLGASLDGLVICQQNGEKWGLEIKCPFSKHGMSLKEALEDKKFFLKQSGDSVTLKISHSYFYQLQVQMFCANLIRTDLVVWFGDNEPLFIESIFFDENFWTSKALPRLDYFYRRATLPEFFTRRFESGIKLYQHGGWVNYTGK